MVLPALSWAQDYIDVEAERKAARAGSGGAASVEVISASAGAADASSSDYPSSDYPSSGYNGTGIRPYSGETITATTENSSAASQAGVGVNAGSLSTGSLNTGSLNVGSLVVQLQQLQEEVRRLNGLVEEAGPRSAAAGKNRAWSGMLTSIAGSQEQRDKVACLVIQLMDLQ